MTVVYREALQRFKVRYWERCLTALNGNVAKAARQNGLNRTYLHCLLDELGLTGFGRPPKKPPIARKPGVPRPLGHQTRRRATEAMSVSGCYVDSYRRVDRRLREKSRGGHHAP